MPPRKGQNTQKTICFDNKITLSPFPKKVEKSMQIGTPKVIIVDAERHRRTPRLSAISGKAIDVWVVVFYGLWPIQCATLADFGRRCHYSTIKNRNTKSKTILLQNGWQNPMIIMPKPLKYHQHGTQNLH